LGDAPPRLAEEAIAISGTRRMQLDPGATNVQKPGCFEQKIKNYLLILDCIRVPKKLRGPTAKRKNCARSGA
jgi:hypothetical protein